jgi:hypothetical protein
LGLTLNVSASVEDRALFLDQGFTATDRLTGVITASLSKDGSSLGIFRRQPLTNNRCDGETDVEAIHQRPVGPVTVEVKVAYISICGPDALDFRLTASRDLGNGFTASVRGEIIRDTGGDGFNDDVLRGRLDYSRRLGQGFTANASVQVAYSSFAGGVSIGGSGGLSREIGNGLSVNATASGYCGPLGCDRAFAFGVSFSR